MNRLKNIQQQMIFDPSILKTPALNLDDPNNIITVGQYTIKIFTHQYRDEVVNLLTKGFMESNHLIRSLVKNHPSLVELVEPSCRIYFESTIDELASNGMCFITYDNDKGQVVVVGTGNELNLSHPPPLGNKLFDSMMENVG